MITGHVHYTAAFYKDLLACADVAAVKAALEDILLVRLTGDDAWEDLGGDTLQSPADDSGRHLRLYMERLDAETLFLEMFQDGVSRGEFQFQIDAAGTNLRVYGGPGHVAGMADQGGGTHTHFWVALINASPRLSSGNVHIVAGIANYDGAGVGLNPNATSTVMAADSIGALGSRIAFPSTPGSSNRPLKAIGDKDIRLTAELCRYDTDGKLRSQGELYGLALVGSDLAAFTTAQVPVDGELIGFDVFPATADNAIKLAIKKGTLVS